MEYKCLIIFAVIFAKVQTIELNTDDNKRIIDDLCLIPCPKIMDPVCGTDGNIFKLFNSPCLMSQHSCESKTDWSQIELDSCIDENISLVRSICEKPCPFIYLPVCGHNSKTSKIFPNQCVMDVENCFSEEKFVLTKFPDCLNVVPS